MSSNTKLIKSANSKGKLAKAVIMYQRTLSHYANESNWAVRGDDIIWVGDDDPTYAAQVTLGKRKPDPTYLTRNKIVREPDIREATASESIDSKLAKTQGDFHAETD
jgi:hypothetical protein